jgi:hypothetical protein
MADLICPECGAKMYESDNVCMNCGEKTKGENSDIAMGNLKKESELSDIGVEIMAQLDREGDLKEEKVRTSSYKSAKKKKSGCLSSILGILSVLFIIGLIIIVL